MSLLNSVLKVFVGDKSKQDVKSIMPIVNEIKRFEPKVSNLSHDELRAKTEEFNRQEVKFSARSPSVPGHLEALEA